VCYSRGNKPTRGVHLLARQTTQGTNAQINDPPVPTDNRDPAKCRARTGKSYVKITHGNRTAPETTPRPKNCPRRCRRCRVPSEPRQYQLNAPVVNSGDMRRFSRGPRRTTEGHHSTNGTHQDQNSNMPSCAHHIYRQLAQPLCQGTRLARSPAPLTVSRSQQKGFL
jgi:hypothetical protein